MKKTLMILMLFMSVNFFGQDFTYKIKLLNVGNIQEAKMATDYLRNTFKTYPNFNDSIDIFEFGSKINVSKIDLVNYLNQYGYTITFFGKSMKQEIIFKEEEK